MTNVLSVENAVRARVGVSLLALLAGCVGVGVGANVAHAGIVETPHPPTLSGAATVTGNLVDGRTITLGAGATANAQGHVFFTGVDRFYNRPMLGYRAEYGDANAFFFDRRALTDGWHYDYVGAPSFGPYPATVTGSTKFGTSGFCETNADAGSSGGGLTLMQQLGMAAPLVASNKGLSINIFRQGPSIVNFSCDFTIDVTRAATDFGALGVSIPSAYNDQFVLEMETFVVSPVLGISQESRSASWGFSAGQAGTQTRTLHGGATFYQRDDEPYTYRPFIEIFGRVRWINEVGESIVLPGSEFQYVYPLVPAPGSAVALLGCGGVVALRRRRGK